MAIYKYWLTTQEGQRIYPNVLDEYLRVVATKEVNRIGNVEVLLPPIVKPEFFTPDMMIQIWRAPEGSVLQLWNIYLIRKWRYVVEGGSEIIVLTGYDGNELLRRRIAAHYTGEAEVSWTNKEADDLMKEVVRDAVADGINPAPEAGTREWPMFTVAPDYGNGPQLTMDFAWKPLLTMSGSGILPKICSAAKAAGTDLYFNVNPLLGSTELFQFQSYIDKVGRDMTDITRFDSAFGTLKDPYLEYNYENEANYIYAGGQGQENGREIQQVSDATRYSASAWNRSEAFKDARDQTAANGVREEARELLEDSRPKVVVGGIPVDTPSTKYGVDWKFGDKVTAVHRGVEVEALIKSLVLTDDPIKGETIKAKLVGEMSL